MSLHGTLRNPDRRGASIKPYGFCGESLARGTDYWCILDPMDKALFWEFVCLNHPEGAALKTDFVGDLAGVLRWVEPLVYVGHQSYALWPNLINGCVIEHREGSIRVDGEDVPVAGLALTRWAAPPTSHASAGCGRQNRRGRAPDSNPLLSADEDADLADIG
jgi:hypothetical protein